MTYKTFLDFLSESRSNDIDSASYQLSSFFSHLGAIYVCEYESEWCKSVSNAYNIMTKKLKPHKIDTKSFILNHLNDAFDDIVLNIQQKICNYPLNQRNILHKEDFALFVKHLLDLNPVSGSIIQDYVESKLDIIPKNLSSKRKSK